MLSNVLAKLFGSAECLSNPWAKLRGSAKVFPTRWRGSADPPNVFPTRWRGSADPPNVFPTRWWALAGAAGRRALAGQRPTFQHFEPIENGASTRRCRPKTASTAGYPLAPSGCGSRPRRVQVNRCLRPGRHHRLVFFPFGNPDPGGNPRRSSRWLRPSAGATTGWCFPFGIRTPEESK